jgi:hypothetical protein
MCSENLYNRSSERVLRRVRKAAEGLGDHREYVIIYMPDPFWNINMFRLMLNSIIILVALEAQTGGTR